MLTTNDTYRHGRRDLLRPEHGANGDEQPNVQLGHHDPRREPDGARRDARGERERGLEHGEGQPHAPSGAVVGPEVAAGGQNVRGWQPARAVLRQGLHYGPLFVLHLGRGQPLARQLHPEGCVAVRLVPQCAVLEDLREGSMASYDFVGSARGYEDVAVIDWSQCSQW